MKSLDQINYPDLNGLVCFRIVTNNTEIDCPQHVISITTSHGFNKISSLEIVLNNIVDFENEEYISDKDIFDNGNPIEVYVGYDKPDNCIFKGSIIKRSISQINSILTITAKHDAENLASMRKMQCFENQKDSDIIQSICSDEGITLEVDTTDCTLERIVQYNCSCWDFINMRAEANAMIVYTTEEGVFAKHINQSGAPSLDIINGYNIIDIEAEADSRCSHKTFNIEGWNYTEQNIAKNTSSSPDITFNKEGQISGGSQDIISTSSLEDNCEISSYHENLSVRNDLSFVKGKITLAGYAPLHPNDLVRLSKLGKAFNGIAVVSNVIQTIGEGRWNTMIEIGYDNTPYISRYDDIVAQPTLGSLPSINGLQIAKVEAIEGDPIGEGRIYIRLLNSNVTKLWARVSAFDAGNERGSFFMPEIDDEVIVGFIDNNPNQAIVLGMLHCNKAPQPYELKDDNNIKGYVSREKIKVTIDDEKKSLTLETPEGNKITLNDDNKGISLEDQNGNTIQMNDNGITIESKKALTIKASQDINIEGNNINITANSQLKAQGNASAELSASGNTVIKGGLVQIN